MNLRMLSKEIQCVLSEGVTNLVVYKSGRKWCYSLLLCDDSNIDKLKIELIKERIDSCCLELNGYDDFIDYTLIYIQKRILKLYQENKNTIRGNYTND